MRRELDFLTFFFFLHAGLGVGSARHAHHFASVSAAEHELVFLDVCATEAALALNLPRRRLHERDDLSAHTIFLRE